MKEWVVGCPDAWAPEVRDVIASRAPDAFDIRFCSAADGARWNALLAESDFLLLATTKVDADFLRQAAKVRLIHRWGIGYDTVDLDAAQAAGVFIAITAGANSNAVAEHTIMHILSALRRLTLVDRALRDGRWLFKEMRVQCLQLRNRTVGLVGLGNIGRSVARKLTGFETRTLYYDPRRAPPDVERALGVTFVPFAQLLAESDIISIHCPGGAENHHLFDAAKIAQMKDKAVLINCARGEIVDEQALVGALRSGKLSAAGLDVFEIEPLGANSALLSFDNVSLSPHTAASVFDNVAHVADHAFGNMLRALHGVDLPPDDAIVLPRKPRFPPVPLPEEPDA